MAAESAQDRVVDLLGLNPLARQPDEKMPSRNAKVADPACRQTLLLQMLQNASRRSWDDVCPLPDNVFVDGVVDDIGLLLLSVNDSGEPYIMLSASGPASRIRGAGSLATLHY